MRVLYQHSRLNHTVIVALAAPGDDQICIPLRLQFVATHQRRQILA